MTNNNKLAQVTGENFDLYEMWELIMKMNRAKENARKEKRKKLTEEEIWKGKNKRKEEGSRDDKEKKEKSVLKRNILGRKSCKMKMKMIRKGWKARLGLHEPLEML